MKNTQQGFGLILLIGGLVTMILIFVWYFTKSSEKSKTQIETGQEAVQQAKDINQRSYQQAKDLNQQLEIQNELNAN